LISNPLIIAVVKGSKLNSISFSTFAFKTYIELGKVNIIPLATSEFLRIIVLVGAQAIPS